MRQRFLPLLAVACVAFSSREAWAGKYDLDLTPLGRASAGGTLDPDHEGFRSLSSELGNVMAFKPVDPADSLGLSGFAIAADISINTIGGDREYWQDTTDGAATNIAPTVQVLGRKGLWPGLEIGAGATHLFDSRMWTLGAYGKIAIHEGFPHLPIPAIALRIGGSQLLGARDLRISMITPGAEISHVFGVGRTVSLTPYLGYEALVVLASSNVIDATPNCDEYPDDYNDDCPSTGDAEFVFKDQSAIIRHRPYVGARIVFGVLRFVFEAMVTPPGSTNIEIDDDNVEDNAKLQQSYTFSIGLDF